MTKFWMMSGVFALMAACGGGNGDKSLSDLSASELVDLCEDSADLLGEPRTVTCDGFEVEITPPDCSTAGDAPFPAGCDVTVDEYLDCTEALAADPCLAFSGTPPAECTALFNDPECNSEPE